jgi:hypothetical protein
VFRIVPRALSVTANKSTSYSVRVAYGRIVRFGSGAVIRIRSAQWLLCANSGHPSWWHFSWGDQLWAALTNATSAHYGLATIPE